MFKKMITYDLNIQINSTYCDPKLKDYIFLQMILDYVLDNDNLSKYTQIRLISICDNQFYWNFAENNTNIFLHQWLQHMNNLLNKYANIVLPNIIFIMSFNDGDFTMLGRNMTPIPYFQFEGSIKHVASNSNKSSAMLLSPRSYHSFLRQYLTQVEKKTKANRSNPMNMQLFMNQQLKSYHDHNYNNGTQFKQLSWNERSFRARFRGSASGTKHHTSWIFGNYSSDRFDIIGYNFSEYDMNNIIDIKFVNCKWSSCNGMPIKYIGDRLTFIDQMNDKFIVNIDGNSVADRMPFQMILGSVMLKYRSNYIEFWYYHLKNNVNVIQFNSAQQLIQILKNWNSTNMNGQMIADNARKLIMSHYNETIMDCFDINMLQYYSKQFQQA